MPANHPTYIVSQADYDALQAMLHGKYLHVIAPRQVGKTSLLKRLARHLSEEDWSCAYVDMSTLTGLTKSLWYAELGKVLARFLTPGYFPALSNQIDLYHYIISPVLSGADGKRYVALFFDEIESVCNALDEHGESFSDDFFMVLRSLYNQRDSYEGTLVVALAGAMSPEHLVRNPDISPFNIGEKINMEDFTLIDTRVLTEHLTELGLIVDQPVYQTIYDWAQGHPYLTQRICFELERIAYRNHLSTVTTQNVVQVIEKIILNAGNQIMGDTNLSHVMRRLNHLSHSANELWSRIQSGEVVLEREIIDNIYLELYLTGVVKIHAGQITIRNRIYKEALLKKKDFTRDAKIQGEALTKEIKSEKTKEAIRIFYSYAHQDEALLKKLDNHLSMMRQKGLIIGWHKREISAGLELFSEIEKHLNTAHIILLLVSPDFSASNYCYGMEVKRAMERHEANDACVIPVILRPIDWKDMPFGKLKVLPENEKPVTSWRDRDSAFLNIALGIRKAIEEIKAK